MKPPKPKLKAPKPKTFWERMRADIREEKMFYGFGQTAVPGLVTIEALHLSAFVPLAFVQYRWIDHRQLDVGYSWVRPEVRGLGLREYLHKMLLQAYPEITTITTNSATRHGAAWMQKAGYKELAHGSWVFHRKPKRKRK